MKQTPLFPRSCFHANRFIRVVMAIIATFFIMTGYSGADEPDKDIPQGQATSITFGGNNANSFSTAYNDATNSGVGFNSVNLYTGQHQESFPLVSVPGRGGLGVSLTLDYNGTVAARAKTENRKDQASPFGLGFSLGMQSIVCNHRGTPDYHDDSYTMLLGGTAVGLRSMEDSLFVPVSGDPWLVYRHLGSIDGRLMVTGWTVLREDGTKYIYGDCDTVKSVWNATRNVLRYGNYVGMGITPDDEKYPFQWDLKKVCDAEELTCTEFIYLQETAYLTVRADTGGTTTNSANTYIRASYIDTIRTADGYEINLEYVDRADYQPFYGLNYYEFYQTKKIDKIIARGPNGDSLSQTEFEFEYLNASRGAQFQKLLLKSITQSSANGTDNLLPLAFEYHTEDTAAWFGSIWKTYFPTGGVKEIDYDLVDSDANFSQLKHDVMRNDSLDSTGGNPLMRLSGDVCLTSYVSSTLKTVAIWDGYWRSEDFWTYGESRDVPGISADGWVALPFDTASILVKRWMGGYWDTDTLENVITREGGEEVYIWPGKNSFVVSTGENSSTKRECRRAYYFHFNGSEWIDNLIIDNESEPYVKHWALLSDDVFVISMNKPNDTGVWKDDLLVMGKWLDSSETVVTKSVSYTNTPLISLNRFKVSTNSVGWIHFGTAFIERLEGTEWVRTSYSGNGAGFQALAATSNGYTFSYAETDGTGSHYTTKVFASDSIAGVWVTTCGGDCQSAGLWATSNATISYHPTIDPKRAYLREWNGHEWIYPGDYVLEGSLDSGLIQLFDDSYIVGPTGSTHSGQLKAKRYFGNGLWPSNNDDSTLYVNVSAGHQFGWDFVDDLIVTTGDTTKLYLWNPYYLKTNYICVTLDNPTFPNVVQVSKSASGTSCYIRDLETVGDSSYYVLNAYRLIDTLATGKPRLPVISSVKLYQFADDDNPRVQGYSYNGGLLDQDGRTPKFCQAQVSTPYYEDDGAAAAYAVQLFYNGIDSTTFYDLSIGDSIEIPADLLDSTTYGLRGGGFHLDGQVYLSYSYDTSGTYTDSTRSFYTTYHPYASTNSIFKTRLDSARSNDQGIEAIVFYTYDQKSGAVVKTKTRHKEDSSFIVQESHLAYKSDDSIEAYNALMLVDSTWSYYESPDTTIWLSKQASDFGKHGSWQAEKVLSWKDGGASMDTMTTLEVLTWDSLGNALESRDANGVASTVKYDPDGVRPITSIVNGRSNESFFFDAEYDFVDDTLGHDGWVRGGGYPVLTDSRAFTGIQSLRFFRDSRGAPEVLLGRIISPDSLLSDVYLLSLWIKMHASSGRYLGMKGYDADSTLEYEIDYLLGSAPDTNWHNTQVSFDISDWNNYDFAYVYIALDVPTADSMFVDDIRFHPIDAQAATTTYNPNSGAVTSQSNVANMPTKYTFDEFWRPKTTWDYNTKLSEMDYFSELNEVQDTTGYFEVDHSVTLDSLGFFVVPVNDDYYWRFEWAVDYDWSPTCQGIIAHTQNLDSLYVSGCTNNTLGEPYSGDSTGWLFLEAGDTMFVYGWADCMACDTSEASIAFYSREQYNSNHHVLNWTKSIAYSDAVDSTVSYGYYDGLGRTLQTRSTAYGLDTAITLISGVAEYDASGRVTKAYKPFYDLVGSSDVDDFSPWDLAMAEVAEYYNDTNAVDCDDNPYSEVEYYQDTKGRAKQSASAGAVWSMGSNHTTRYQYHTDATNQLYIDSAWDADDILSMVTTDKFGMISTSVVPYVNTSGGDDTLRTVTYKNIRGATDSVLVREAGSMRVLRRQFLNDRGLAESTWKVDYGTIGMLYDKTGNMRFMRNEKRVAEGNFVYFKYDALGRKIEEGVLEGTNYFTQANADDSDFPETVPDSLVDVTYRWFYDMYTYTDTVADSSYTIVEPGALVRVESGDSSFFKQFYSFPEERSDLTIVKLPINGGSSLKAIKHFYDASGAIESMEVYPAYPSTAGKRSFVYDYDVGGRLKSISQGIHGKSLDYGEYTYNADGGFDAIRYGIYDYNLSGDTIHDTAQKVDYYYNSRGQLSGINLTGKNDSSTVDNSTSGGVSGADDNDHFGHFVEYFDTTSGNGYYNGRVGWTTTAHSLSSDVKFDQYELTYNDAGWLTKAKNLSNSSLSRDYRYNSLGNRDTVYIGPINSATDTIVYTYYDDEPGSSRLHSISGMGGDSLVYDVLGNLIKDESQQLDTLKYDYRNLLTFCKTGPEVNGSLNRLYFGYDGTGLRISKTHAYQYWDDCGGGGVVESMGAPGSGFEDPDLWGDLPDSIGSDSLGLGIEGVGGDGIDGPGGKLCPYWAYNRTYYLYDGNVLLATFDGDDDVLEMFVNGPNGRIASYKENEDQYLYYFLNDHLGSARVLMHAETGTTPSVAQTYLYYPFGEVMEAVGNYHTAFQFTGKELDDHSTFEFSYFGARYYNASIGGFTTIDKASQYPNGYSYGGNNPIIGVDPDGNLFFTPFLVGAAYGALFSATSYTTIALSTGNWSLEGLGTATLMGTISGGIGASLSAVGGQLANNLSYSMMSNAVSNATTSAIMGQDISIAGLAGGAVGGLAAGKLVGNYSTPSSSRALNIGAELTHSATSGAISSVVGGATTNILEGRRALDGVGQNLAYGALGGVGQAAAKNILLGGPVQRTERHGIRQHLDAADKALGIEQGPVYRSGGLWGLASNIGLLPKGFAGFGRDILINETGDPDDDIYLWKHETAHYYQQSLWGWGETVGQLAWEQVTMGSNAYGYGTWERNAEIFGTLGRSPY